MLHAVGIGLFNGKPQAPVSFVADACGLPLNDGWNCALLNRVRPTPEPGALLCSLTRNEVAAG